MYLLSRISYVNKKESVLVHCSSADVNPDTRQVGARAGITLIFIYVLLRVNCSHRDLFPFCDCSQMKKLWAVGREIFVL